MRETKDRLLLTILRGSGALPFSLSEVMQTYSVALQKQIGTTFGLVLEDNQSGGVVIVNVVRTLLTCYLCKNIVINDELRLRRYKQSTY